MSDLVPQPKERAGERRRDDRLPYRHRVTVVSDDAALAATLGRFVQASGVAVTRLAAAALAAPPSGPPNLWLVDLRTGPLPLERLAALYPDGRFIAIVDSAAAAALLDPFRARGCVGALTVAAALLPEELIVTVAKLLQGPVFGLQKYLPWGVALSQHSVSAAARDEAALEELAAEARRAGASEAMAAEVGAAAEELLGQLRACSASAAASPAPASVKISSGASGRRFYFALHDAGARLDRHAAIARLRDLRLFHSQIDELIFNLAAEEGAELIAAWELPPAPPGRLRAVHVVEERRRSARTPPPLRRPTPRRLPDGAALVVGALALFFVVVGLVGALRLRQARTALAQPGTCSCPSPRSPATSLRK